MTPENPNEEMSLSERLSKWFDSPEGKASIERMKDEHRREENTKMRFAMRVKGMTTATQDYWMHLIIDKYNSKKYNEYWYNKGIFPPYWLFGRIREFIVENGMQVSETEDGEPIYQYGHWLMDCAHGQGECHHNFIFTTNKPHRYGANIYYVIRHYRRKIHMLDNLIFKSWDDAKLVVDGFIGSCKSKGIQDVFADEFEIVEITIGNPSDVVKQIDYLVKTTPIF